jgi:hypothetical protein
LIMNTVGWWLPSAGILPSGIQSLAQFAFFAFIEQPMTLLRRLIVLLVLAFWQGGFAFYAAVAAPVTSEVLGSARERSVISQKITRYLNLVGAVALVPLAWDAASSRDPAAWRRWLRWLAFFAMALSLAMLLWLQFQFDDLQIDDPYGLLYLGDFPQDHWYLWISIFQWECAMLYLVLMVHAWRCWPEKEQASSNVAG